MKEIKKFSIHQAEGLFRGPWDPKDLVEISGFVARVARFEGRYGDSHHTHEYDEFFLVLDGKIEIDTDQGKVELQTLEGAVIPAGIEHQPFAHKPALVLMLDPKE